MKLDMGKALVVLSGGQDSTTCLFWSMQKFGSENVSAVTFDYGQRQRVELTCAGKIADDANIVWECLPIDTFSALGGNSLTDEDIAVENEIDNESGLPNTFVPGRNLIFLTLAAAWAWRRKIGNIVTGVAQTDYSGYPDCREETIASLEQTLSLGLDSELQLHAPLMHRSKKETVEMAQSLGALEAMRLTHTCYKGERPPCGDCAACKLRARGFAEAGIEDPLLRSS